MAATQAQTSKKKKATKAKAGAPKPKAPPRSEVPMMAALRAEHRHMASVMELMAQQLDAVAEGDLVDTHMLYESMDYMLSWPDRYHHPREDLIYGRVADIDSSAADNVDSLQREHDDMAARGREVLATIEHWRDGKVSGAAVVKAGRDYIARSYKHMNNEEQLVFPQIESILTVQDWRELAEDDSLRPAADPVFGPRIDRDFRNLARKVRRGVRRGVERTAMVEWVGLEALLESFEVMSMAYDSGKDITGEHVRTALDESLSILREKPLTAPLRCAVNNTRLTFSWMGDLADVSRDTLADLVKVNQERKDRVRLLDRERAAG
ncbi:MAG: hemerythrin domain-containing protein [Halieaceae bacterium]